MPEENFTPIPPWVKNRFPPDQRAAIDHFRLLVDADMLRKIAEADYAQDVDKHLSALNPIWSGGELTEMDSWYPMEVLELIRWSEPSTTYLPKDSASLKEHQMRGFCCAALLATPNFEPEKETLIQLLESSILLGHEATDTLGRFMVWQIETLNREGDRPFFAWAIASALHTTMNDISTEQEEELASWLRDEELSERAHLAAFHSDYKSTPWLFGLSFMDMRNAKWKALLRTIEEERAGKPMAALLAANLSS